MKFHISRVPLIVALLHTICIIAFAFWVSHEIKHGLSEKPELLWVLWCVIDFPTGLLEGLIVAFVFSHVEPVAFSTSTDLVPYVVAPTAVFGVIGGLHWYFLTSLLIWIRAAIRSRFRAWRGHCPYCNYNLRGSTGEQCTECGKWIPENVKIRPAVIEPGD